jgi:hypothetical protein
VVDRLQGIPREPIDVHALSVFKSVGLDSRSSACAHIDYILNYALIAIHVLLVFIGDNTYYRDV